MANRISKYAFKNNTYTHEVKREEKDRIQVEIGDVKQPDFKPQYKLMRWDNEVNFSIRAEEDPTATVETTPEKIIYKHRHYDVEMYEKPEVSEDGGFEFEWVFRERPETNVLKATIRTKGLDFFYQPPLTQEEINEGCIRPENVVGSYAVYHKTKSGDGVDGKDYKTGKAFHIYRPKAIDANGSEVWADLNINIEDELLTVTVPQDFIDNAVYPVIVDPTFGYTYYGGTQYLSGYRNNIEGTKFTAPANMTIDSVWALLSAGTAAKGAIYDSSYNLVGSGGDAVTLATGFDFEASYITGTQPTLTSGQDYYIVFWGTDTVTYYDSGGTSLAKSLTYGSWPSSLSSPTSATKIFSCFARYTDGTPAITFAGSRSNTASSGTAVSVSAPPGLQTDDVVIAVVHSNGPKDVTDNNGSAPFTSILSNREYNGPSAQVDIFYRVIDGTEDGTFDFTLSGSDRWSVIVVAFRGVDTSSVFDVAPTSTTENTGSGGTQTTDSITTLTNGAMVVSFAVNDSSSIKYTSYPSGYDLTQQAYGNQTLAMVHKYVDTAGTISSLSWVQSTSSGVWLNNIFALKPATSGDVTVSASVQTITSSIPAPTVTTERNVTVSAGVQTVTVSIPAPTVTAVRNVTVNANAQTITVSQPAATTSTEVNVTVSANVLTLTSSLAAPTISAVQNVTVTPNPQAITISLPTPTVSTGVDVVVSPAVQSITISIPTPTVSVVRNVATNVDVQVLTLTQPAATVSTTKNVSVEVGAQVITVVLPSTTVSCSAVVAVEAQELDFSILSPVITAVRDIEVAADILELDFALLAVTVTADNNSPVLSSRPTTLSQRGASLKLNQSVGRTSLTQGVSKTVLK